MSASTPLVWYHSRADQSARLVLLAIADHDGEGGAWPSVTTLARMTRLSESTVRRAIKALVMLGELTVHLQEGGTSRTPEHSRPNRYVIVLACPVWCDGTARHACRHCGGKADHKPECATGLGHECEHECGINAEPTPQPCEHLCTNTPCPVDNPEAYPLSPVTPPVTGDTPPPVTRDTPPPVIAVTPEPPKETPTEPPAPPSLPESVSALWTGEGIAEEHQRALWAAVIADPATTVPAARARQRAWFVPALAKIKAAEGRATAVHLDAVRRYGEVCDHGTPGGAETHPTTGLPLCPLCRSERGRS